MQWHQAVANNLPNETSLTPVPHTRIYINKQGKERIELESARYDGDLYKLKAYNKITASQSMLLLSQIADTLPAMHDAGFVHIESLGTYIKEQDKQKLARAQARIILMMAREVKNSQELFDYYQRKRHLFSDIHLFLESAAIATPSLSTARTLASELARNSPKPDDAVITCI